MENNELGRSGAVAPSGSQASPGAAGASPPSVSIPNAADILNQLAWCHQQAGEIMAITSGCASTHGDPEGGLEWANSIASDIAINLEMLASGIEAPSGVETAQTGSTEGESPVPEGQTPKSQQETPDA